MADTFPTATTLQPRSPQKNGQSQTDGHVDNHKQKQKKVKTSHDNSKELNGIKTTTDNQLFVKSAKDKQHDRKSRSGRKGEPKKGGAGGKGTWGKPGEVYDDVDMVNDEQDPNYDSEEAEEPYLEELKPELTEEEFIKFVEPIIQEYYEHGDTEEVILSLNELNIHTSMKHKTLALAVTLAMEKKDAQREMASILISDLYGEVVTEDEISQAFMDVLDDLEDVTLDTPDAPEVLGKFIARAVADDCLPPAFVKNYTEDTGAESLQRKALSRADVLLKMKHGMVRLDNVWGVGGGRRPVKQLIKKMVLLLKEYLSSEDIEEASRCLEELEVPHFHHELIYEAMVILLDKEDQRVGKKMVKLFKAFTLSNIVTPDQFTSGFERIYRSMEDLSLDSPHAYQILESFCSDCLRENVITEELKRKMPARGRKRFVSEGDGGALKH
ncbi:programmed cell death protein 4-like [Dendronephthya gigantea]|uniref:programmed cell death protein 4-like n=1 Tax=Dendronephthya gigantea TaxID=151771 RepID=UPI00106C239E|nr:programmed cell death protein 4-like [Dendronephthya gigantea]XP_028414171.1 programmed cell death protein 4-like [Dendronephthya gigantea]